jgi:hypothetical protein
LHFMKCSRGLPAVSPVSIFLKYFFSEWLPTLYFFCFQSYLQIFVFTNIKAIHVFIIYKSLRRFRPILSPLLPHPLSHFWAGLQVHTWVVYSCIRLSGYAYKLFPWELSTSWVQLQTEGNQELTLWHCRHWLLLTSDNGYRRHGVLSDTGCSKTLGTVDTGYDISRVQHTQGAADIGRCGYLVLQTQGSADTGFCRHTVLQESTVTELYNTENITG